MTDDNGFTPFVNGEIRCPACHRKRPMSDLVGLYDGSDDKFTVKGIRCSYCDYRYPHSLLGLVGWGSQMPSPVHIPTVLTEPKCPFCGKVAIRVPDTPFRSTYSREFEYVRCPDSPLLYRMVVR